MDIANFLVYFLSSSYIHELKWTFIFKNISYLISSINIDYILFYHILVYLILLTVIYL